MPKGKLTEEQISDIIKLYQSEIPSTHKLAAKFKVGHKKISRILKEHGVKINSRGAQVKDGDSQLIEKSKISRYINDNDNKKFIAICKKSKIQFDDINNLSGCLTRHIIDTHGNVSVPTNTYQRKKYEMKHGKKWFEEYFDIVEVNECETIKCGLCDWVTTDIDNNTGSLTKHISTKHGLTITEYLNQCPDDKNLWSNYVNRLDELNSNRTSVVCLECNKQFIGLTETHMLSEHGMTLQQYKDKWGDDVKIFSLDTVNKLSEVAKEVNRNMKPTFTSFPQLEIKEYLESELGLTVLNNDRKTLGGIELDLVVPSHNFAIEYNGLYWHTERLGKHKNYHLDKSKLCLDKGIQLIHIFEDEWKNKRDIVISRLNHILGFSKTKIYARKCEIREIDNGTKDEYLERTHLQGADKSSIRLGGYYDNELVGVMTFSKLRKVVGMKNTEDNQYELVRYSNSGVVGLAGKLFSYFIKNFSPDRVVTYADRRWTPDNDNCLYSKLGFTCVGETKPNYWYTKKYKIREHRFNYRKDVLVSLGHDSNKTENEIMCELGYDKIWDCGSYKFILDIIDFNIS